MDHLCGPSPWSPALCGPSPRTNPVDHPKFLKTNFYLRSKLILGTLNGRKLCHFILSGSKASHMICLLKIFLNSIDGFGLIWKEKQYFKIFEEGMRRVERQYSLTQLFLCVASFCMKINTKNDWVGDQRWRGNTWWLSTYPRLPFPHSPLLVSTPPVPLKYDSWLSLPIKTDHSFVHLRFLKFVIDLW